MISRHNFTVILVFLCLLSCCPRTKGESNLVEFTTQGKKVRGLRLVEFANETVVIGLDGWLHSLAPDHTVQPIDGSYEPLPAAQLRNELRAEFGRDYEVIATNHFLVVQPVGRGNRWPDLFEQSHRSFITFMTRRGVDVRKGRFPMVAVVLPDEQTMYNEFRRMKIDKPRVAGLYANASNRIITHDAGGSRWTAETVRHEVAHQSAFNSGVHSRLNDTPKWITEGLGQMFEPTSMADQRAGASLNDMTNAPSLKKLQSKFDLADPREFAQAIEQIVASDAMFKDDKQVELAYAVSWSMMFYLAQRQPEAFATMLNHTASRPPFIEYDRDQRRQDFLRIVGQDEFAFSKHLAHFLLTL
jgi:hypothetical protein